MFSIKEINKGNNKLKDINIRYKRPALYLFGLMISSPVLQEIFTDYPLGYYGLMIRIP